MTRLHTGASHASLSANSHLPHSVSCVLLYAAQGNHRVQCFSLSGSFVRILGSNGRTDRSGFLKPAAVAVVALKADGTVLHMHEGASGEQNSADGSSSSGSDKRVASSLVFVSDAAAHKLQVFK